MTNPTRTGVPSPPDTITYPLPSHQITGGGRTHPSPYIFGCWATWQYRHRVSSCRRNEHNFHDRPTPSIGPIRRESSCRMSPSILPERLPTAQAVRFDRNLHSSPSTDCRSSVYSASSSTLPTTSRPTPAPTPHSAPSTERMNSGSDCAGPDGKESLDTVNGMTQRRHRASIAHHPTTGISCTTKLRPTQRGIALLSRSLRVSPSAAAHGSIPSSGQRIGSNATVCGCRDSNIPTLIR